ncbi:MAG: hypothetical protein PHE18_06115 [Candidatus Omnitrophica bacterium]|nr:hypothetical protein [Candidatus Omnitrophota bacterium]MDD5553434.1 hypothetical protein [Candidatus Omnitrophota bacterium]
MKDKDLALRMAGTVFSLIAILNFVRLVRRPCLINRGIQTPLFINLIGLGVAALMAIWMFYALKKKA